MKNGLYKVEFATQRGAGAGVVVLNNGKVQGGDSALSYDGTYVEDGNTFAANVTTRRHTQGMPSVFGVDNVEIKIEGQIAGDKAALLGSVPTMPGVRFQANLSPIAI